jgi:hypothetical protein
MAAELRMRAADAFSPRWRASAHQVRVYANLAGTYSGGTGKKKGGSRPPFLAAIDATVAQSQASRVAISVRAVS